MSATFNTRKEVLTALIDMATRNTALSTRFTQGPFADDALLGTSLPELLLTVPSEVENESTEDETTVALDAQWDVWTKTDTEAHDAIQELCDCFNGQALVQGDGAVPLDGHTSTIRMSRFVEKEADDDLGEIWHGVVKFEIMFTED